MKTINIHIGEYYSSAEPVVINTILGPCVAVCLIDRKNSIGGMNHILLPGSGSGKTGHYDSRFAVHAMELLINQMMKIGADRYRLRAKIFGGAQVFPFMKQEKAIGLQNIEVVVDFLIKEKIPVINYNFGGHHPRKISFFTDTGDVLLQKIKTSDVKKEFGDIMNKRINLEKKIHESGSVLYFD